MTSPSRPTKEQIAAKYRSNGKVAVGNTPDYQAFAKATQLTFAHMLENISTLNRAIKDASKSSVAKKDKATLAEKIASMNPHLKNLQDATEQAKKNLSANKKQAINEYPTTFFTQTLKALNALIGIANKTNYSLEEEEQYKARDPETLSLGIFSVTTDDGMETRIKQIPTNLGTVLKDELENVITNLRTIVQEYQRRIRQYEQLTGQQLAQIGGFLNSSTQYQSATIAPIQLCSSVSYNEIVEHFRQTIANKALTAQTISFKKDEDLIASKKDEKGAPIAAKGIADMQKIIDNSSLSDSEKYQKLKETVHERQHGIWATFVGFFFRKPEVAQVYNELESYLNSTKPS